MRLSPAQMYLAPCAATPAALRFSPSQVFGDDGLKEMRLITLLWGRPQAVANFILLRLDFPSQRFRSLPGRQARSRLSLAQIIHVLEPPVAMRLACLLVRRPENGWHCRASYKGLLLSSVVEALTPLLLRL